MNLKENRPVFKNIIEEKNSLNSSSSSDISLREINNYDGRENSKLIPCENAIQQQSKKFAETVKKNKRLKHIFGEVFTSDDKYFYFLANRQYLFILMKMLNFINILLNTNDDFSIISEKNNNLLTNSELSVSHKPKIKKGTPNNTVTNRSFNNFSYSLYSSQNNSNTNFPQKKINNIPKKKIEKKTPKTSIVNNLKASNGGRSKFFGSNFPSKKSLLTIKTNEKNQFYDNEKEIKGIIFIIKIKFIFKYSI